MSKRLSPSFSSLSSASASASKAKASNKCQGTEPERIVRRELASLGVKYRANDRSLPGKPDIVIPQAMLAVFCDGEFWHGRYWGALRRKLKRRYNPSYWIAKISYNRKRDAAVDDMLTAAGWRVLRLWDRDIRSDPRAAALLIAKIMRSGLAKGANRHDMDLNMSRPRAHALH